MKRGLVLEGGAMRGLFTAGIMDVMMENDIALDGVVGVSAGACFGCNYKSHQPGRAIRYNMQFARDDNVVNLCECKFSRQPYLLTLGDEQNLANKIERVSQDVAKHKSIHTTLVAPYGVEKNAYSDVIQSVVSADDLFAV